MRKEMPENTCRVIWKCPKCEATVKPKQGDCCMFVSLADMDPSCRIQVENIGDLYSE